ncbi:MAG: FeoB-associated Cys-rich membrane protein [Clostridia bacterium]|nr:FeoB-associated Cys-rich membrane protein [Clostridia bacterium]
MFEWLKANLATVLISAALVAVITAIIVGMAKRKKKGGGGSCGCAECPMRGACHGGKKQ